MKKILLLEPDKEQAELLADWLKGEAYSVSSIDNPEQVPTSLANEIFDILVIDIDTPEIWESSFKLIKGLKADVRYTDLPMAVIAHGKETKKVIAAVETGVDIFLLKPFETDSFLKRVENVFANIELKSKGKKMLDLNFLNYLIELTGQMERDDFFALSPVIANKLIIEKINTILGDPIIAQIIKRLNESIGADYEFMKSVEYSDKGLSLDSVNAASKAVPVKTVANAYRDYVYALLHLVKSLTSDILMERNV